MKDAVRVSMPQRNIQRIRAGEVGTISQDCQGRRRTTASVMCWQIFCRGSRRRRKPGRHRLLRLMLPGSIDGWINPSVSRSCNLHRSQRREASWRKRSSSTGRRWPRLWGSWTLIGKGLPTGLARDRGRIRAGWPGCCLVPRRGREAVRAPWDWLPVVPNSRASPGYRKAWGSCPSAEIDKRLGRHSRKSCGQRTEIDSLPAVAVTSTCHCAWMEEKRVE